MNHMHQISSYSLDEVLPYVGENYSPRKYEVDGVEYSVKMSSVRLQCFKKNVVCVCCGINGSVMILEIAKKQFLTKHSGKMRPPHFNLYAVSEDGSLLLMTKDHIVPKSKGGSDKLSNMQTMCTTCNGIKSNSEISVQKLKELREEGIESRLWQPGGEYSYCSAEQVEQLATLKVDLRTKYSHVLSSKYCNLLAVQQIELPQCGRIKGKKKTHSAIRAIKKLEKREKLCSNTAMNLFWWKGSIYARSIFDPKTDGEKIGELEANVEFTPIGAIKSMLFCRYIGGFCLVPEGLLKGEEHVESVESLGIT